MHDTTAMNDITRRAQKAIGEDRPNADWVLRPEEHASRLPPEAGALKRILEREDFRKSGEQYRDCDGEAVWAQWRYKRAGGIALGAALAATLIGALFLLVPARELSATTRVAGAVVEYSLLLVAFVAAQYSAIWRPFDAWMGARANAEIARIGLFDAVMKAREDARPDELPLLPLKLEYFRRYQFDVQNRYYDRRGAQHQSAARRVWTLQFVSFVIAAIAGTIGFLEILSLLNLDSFGFAGFLSQGLAEAAGAIKIDGERLLLALGVAASAIYGFAAALSLMALHERNAKRYRNTHDNLNHVAQTSLEPARAAAAANREKEVSDFVDCAQALISSEHQEWVRWRDMTPEPDVRAVYIMIPRAGT